MQRNASVGNGNYSNSLKPHDYCVNRDESIVSVRAQVMCWNETYNGWLPYEGGGLSNITLIQRLPANHIRAPIQRRSWSPGYVPLNGNDEKHIYSIAGRRCADHKLLLSCVLCKDISYRQVMPTFHHWQMGEHKFGLSFLCSYDAAKFHNRIQKAIEHLHRHDNASSAESNFDAEELEDDVFVSVELPLSQASSGTSSSRSGHSQPLLSRGASKSVSPLPQSSQTAFIELCQPQSTPSYPYVYFKSQQALTDWSQKPLTSSAEYHYPTFPSHRPVSTSHSASELSHPRFRAPPQSRPSTSSLKLPTYGLQPILLPLRKKGSKSGLEIIRREQCIYCKLYYNTAENRAGVCPDAPDPWRQLARRVSCYRCAECAVFCCLREDGELPSDVCSCSRDEPHRWGRWLLLGLVACLVPCLWCYLPLRCCCRVGGLKGAKHRPMPRESSTRRPTRSTKSSRLSF